MRSKRHLGYELSRFPRTTEFFTNIGPSLDTKTPHSTVDHKSYLSGSFTDSYFASPTTPDEIINIESSLKSSNSEGVDGINVNVIKASIDLLAFPLSQMCNISFSTGIVPDKLKISKVIPMFKSEDSTNFTKYGPLLHISCGYTSHFALGLLAFSHGKAFSYV